MLDNGTSMLVLYRYGTHNTMKLITYSKEFLTGNLKGIIVRQSLTVPDSETHTRSMELQHVTLANPGTDCVTGDKFRIYNVGSQEIPSPKHTQDAQCDIDSESMLCKQCGADHGSEPCYCCGGVAFHQDACAEVCASA